MQHSTLISSLMRTLDQAQDSAGMLVHGDQRLHPLGMPQPLAHPQPARVDPPRPYYFSDPHRAHFDEREAAADARLLAAKRAVAADQEQRRALQVESAPQHDNLLRANQELMALQEETERARMLKDREVQELQAVQEERRAAESQPAVALTPELPALGRQERLRQAGVIQAQRDREELEKQVSISAAGLALDKQRNEIREFVAQDSVGAGFRLSEKQRALRELEAMEQEKQKVEAEVTKALKEKLAVEEEMKKAEEAMRAAAFELETARCKVDELHQRGDEEREELAATVAMKERIQDEVVTMSPPGHIWRHNRGSPTMHGAMASPGIQAECEAALWQQMEARLTTEVMAWRTRAEATEAELRVYQEQVGHVEHWKRRCAEAEDEAVVAGKHKLRTMQELESLEAELKSSKAAANQSESELARCNVKVSGLEEKLAAAQAQLQEFLDHSDEALQREVQNRLLGSEQTIALLETQRTELDRTKAEAQQRALLAEQTASDCTAQVTEMKVELAKARAGCAEAEARACRAEEEMAKLLTATDAAQQAAQELEQAQRESAEELQGEICRLQKENARLGGVDVEGLQQEVAVLKQERAALAAQLEVRKAHGGEAPRSGSVTGTPRGSSGVSAERLIKAGTMMSRLSEAAAAAQQEVGHNAAKRVEADSTTDRLNRVESTIQRLSGLGLVDLGTTAPAVPAMGTSCDSHLKEYQVLLSELQSVRLAMAQRSRLLGQNSAKAAEVLSGAASTDQQLQELQRMLAQSGSGLPAHELRLLYEHAQQLRLQLESDIRALQ